MPTYTWDEQFTGRTGGTSETAGQKLTRTFEVVSSVANDNAGQVIWALAVLAGVYKRAAHPGYAYALCTNIDATPSDVDPFRWEVRADYEEPPPEPGTPPPTVPPPPPPGSPPPPPAQQSPSPEDKLARVSGGFRRRDEWPISSSSGKGRATVDRNGAPIKNSFGDPFDDPPPIPRADLVITLTRWMASFSPFDQKQWMNATNEVAFLGFDAYNWLVTAVDFTPITIKGWDGFQVVYQLHQKDVPTDGSALEGQTGGWQYEAIVDAGWNWKAGPTRPTPGATYNGVDDKGQRLQNPRLLNGSDGTELPADTLPQYQHFQFHNVRPFGPLLNIPLGPPPTITDTGNQTGAANATIGPVGFIVNSTTTPVRWLTVTAVSSDTDVLPVANITFGGSGANRTVTIKAPAASGTATVTLTVTDANGLTATDSFAVTVP